MFNGAQYRLRVFPQEAVRDLLGLVRAIRQYRLTVTGEPRTGTAELELLQSVQRDLEVAVQCGHHQPGSMGHAAAWRRAERAGLSLYRCVAGDEALRAVVRHAVAPLRPKR